MDSLKRTPLYEEHIKANGRMVPFAGWEMPVQYRGVIEEHENVRKNVGLFDVSHMGEVFVSGPKALDSLQYLTTNDVSKLEPGQAQYSLLLNPNGGIVDDIIVYCIEKGVHYLVCVNASNTEKDYQWMVKNNKGAVIENQSDRWAQIAVQGPRAVELVAHVLGPKHQNTETFEFGTHQGPGGIWYVARTGYTGEDGYEIFLPNSDAPRFWQDLMNKGNSLGVQPIGLGARDTLRTEMKYSLYGNEITDETSPLEAGLGWVVKLQKGDFIGRAPLVALKESGVSRKLVGFKLLEKGIPRHGYPLVSEKGDSLGVVTSGTMSPTLKEAIGIGYVAAHLSSEGSRFFVQIRGRNLAASVVKTPFVKTKGE
ncbi:MAG: glycine cleavage system aminomethyltransferase GcvT [Oligoflexia bacterium]|nr:glycine cleavage system aminomethyltransferase GcvT [Oligoflexia bacterium]